MLLSPLPIDRIETFDVVTFVLGSVKDMREAVQPASVMQKRHPTTSSSTREVESIDAQVELRRNTQGHCLPQSSNYGVQFLSHQIMPRSDEATAFFHAVYSAVCEIPYGKVTTYGHIVALVGTRAWSPFLCRRSLTFFSASIVSNAS